MTQKQKRNIAYGAACVLLIASFFSWTWFIHQSLAYDPYQWPPLLQETPSASMPGMENENESLQGDVLSAEASDEAWKQHSSVPQEVIGREQDTAPAPTSLHEAFDELRYWELRRDSMLSIPSLNIEAPVYLPSPKYWDSQQWDLLEEQMQIGLSHGVVAYPHSVSAGRKGALILAGHSSPPDTRAAESAYGSLFAKLTDIQEGDRVTILSDGVAIDYIVDGKTILAATATEILKQDRTQSILKLITCYPVGTTKNRLVVTAHRVER